MDSLRAFFHQIGSFDGLQQLIGAGGLIILVGIVYAETGLLVGFFLPGDSLLITAGFVASTKPELLQLWALLTALPLAAICGDSTGYLIGRKTGEALYNRPRSRMFHPDKLLRTKAFYDRYGPATVAFARFMPFARTFAPVGLGLVDEPDRLLFRAHSVRPAAHGEGADPGDSALGAAGGAARAAGQEGCGGGAASGRGR
ncbi:MAG: VTT domain-containing protein [Armatimonadetes bacterium]|nr:VTT domain-containing protein [Armatimonadota bacterium]